MQVKVSIIIAVFGQKAFTRQCLKDLEPLGHENEIIVWDNGSSDGTDEMMADLLKDWKGPEINYIKFHENLGFGRALNRAYRVSNGEYILFLNNDIRVLSNRTNWLDGIIENVGEGVVAQQSGQLDEKFNFVREGRFSPNEKYCYLSGWFLLAKKKTFDSLVLKDSAGPWCEAYFAYFEDVDLSWRAKEKNISISLTTAPLHHFGRQTGGKMNLSKLYLESKEIFTKIWRNRC